jgi:glutathione S-transferase
VPFLLRPITKLMGKIGEKRFSNQEIAKHWDFLEGSLAKSGDYFAGPNLTGADFIMSYPLQAALEARILDKTKYPKLKAWVDRIEAREAYHRAIKVVEAKTAEKFSLAPGMY